MLRFHIPIILIALAIAAPSASDPTCRDDVAFEPIRLRQNFSVFEFPRPEDLVLRTEDQWCDFWERVHGGFADPPPCDPAVADFRSEAVIATVVGVRANACHMATISCVETSRGRGALRVFVVERVPADVCLCPQSFVNVMAAAVVEKPVGRVEFVDETSVMECLPR